MHATSDLVPHLADRGVVMTPTQVYRIVTSPPARMNMKLLSALCDLFGCGPGDLIEPYVVSTSRRARKAVGQRPDAPRRGGAPRAVRAQVVHDPGDT
ncbi:helix-turn-helix domain-containing protein [Janibacter sp. G349]|nr:helix-turn-helix transcriptional regulator [Micrococcales bacterium]